MASKSMAARKTAGKDVITENGLAEETDTRKKIDVLRCGQEPESAYEESIIDLRQTFIAHAPIELTRKLSYMCTPTLMSKARARS